MEAPSEDVQAERPLTTFPRSFGVAPTLGQDGAITFTYGANLPSIVCAPLHVCDVQLQPGETIQQLEVGDPVRWSVKIGKTASEDGVETPHLIVKPAATSISSNAIVLTDRRTYSLRLATSKDANNGNQWMPKVAFAYPEDAEKVNQAYFQAHASGNSPTYASYNTVAMANSPAPLNFQYKIHGDKPVWRPTRVYSDRNKTYIQLPEVVQYDEIPVLYDLGPGNTKQLVNYRWTGNQFIVDKVLKKADLVSGIGKYQQTVSIVQEGG